MTNYIKGTLTDYLKTGVSKSFVHVIKHGIFQLYNVHQICKQTSSTFCQSNDVSL